MAGLWDESPHLEGWRLGFSLVYSNKIFKSDVKYMRLNKALSGSSVSMNFEILDELLNSSVPDRDARLFSLGHWDNDLPFVDTEEEINQKYIEFVLKVNFKYGEPIYNGEGPMHNSGAPTPKCYFEEHESALRCAWWKHENQEIMLSITGHDADTLQFILVAVSNNENDQIGISVDSL